jgi:hypothetical protein
MVTPGTREGESGLDRFSGGVDRRAGDGGRDELDGILDDLERKGIVRRGSGALPAGFLTHRLPRAGRSVVDALLEERREGR